MTLIWQNYCWVFTEADFIMVIENIYELKL